jgi:hypothetical protein
MEKSNVFVGGAMFAAFVSSLCCVLPLIAVVFGLGAFGTAAIFETVRYPMIVVAVCGPGVWFYRVYFRREECAEGEACATKPVSRINKIFLWIGTIVIVAFALSLRTIHGLHRSGDNLTEFASYRICSGRRDRRTGR